MALKNSIEDELNIQRVIVLFECEDDKFRQVRLTGKQYKKVTDAISSIAEIQPEDLKPEYQLHDVKIKEGWEMDADNFIGLADYYEEDSPS